MPKFYSSYNRPPSKAHAPFPFVQKDYIKDAASGELVECGTIPFYERIQSFHESTTLSAKLKRFAMGDNTALGMPGGSFGDVTQMPNDLRSILDSRKKVLEDFNNLPDDLRGIFENDFDKFESSVRDGTVERRIYDHIKSTSPQGQAPGAGGQAEGGN